MAAPPQQGRFVVVRRITFSLARLPGLFLGVCMILPSSPADAQGWVELPSISLLLPADGLVCLAVAPWDDGFYILDGLGMEVLAVDAEGRLRHRYGGWGTGVLSLDLPRDLIAAENSVFVLDQEGHRILRLDSRLNYVAATPLPEEWLPLAFVRDARQRFWVAFENRAGLYIYDDSGTLVDLIGDETSGAAAVLHPTLMAASPAQVAVWDHVEQTLALFRLSGKLQRRLPLPEDFELSALIWAGGKLLLAAADGLYQVDPAEGIATRVADVSGLMDLAWQAPKVYGLDTTGRIRVLQVP